MQNIIIEYLHDQDKGEPAYTAAKNELKDTIRCYNKESFFKAIKRYNTDQGSLTLTLLSHGAIQNDGNETVGITFNNSLLLLITWKEVVEHVNYMRTNYPLILNLLAICSSKSIMNACAEVPNRIDEILYTTNEVLAIKRVLSCNSLGAEKFWKFFDDDDEELFKWYKLH